MEENLQEEIQRLIGRNKTDEAIKLLSQVQFSKADRELIILNSRYNRVKEELMLNTISAEEAERKINQINLALLDLSRKMDGKGDVLNLGSGVSFNRQWLWLLVLPLVALIWFFIPLKESSTKEPKTEKVENPEGNSEAAQEKAAREQAAREQEAREQEAREQAIKKVRFTLNAMKVISDGDGFTEGKGDFLWTIKVNDKLLDQRTSELQLDDGATHTFNKSADFELSEDNISELKLVAQITEADDGLSGDDDRIEITHSYSLKDLDFPANKRINGRKQGDDGGDPKVELSWTLQLLPN